MEEITIVAQVIATIKVLIEKGVLVAVGHRIKGKRLW